MGSSESDESLESYGSDMGDRSNPFARVREWILVDGDRLLLAIVLSVLVFFLLLSLDRLDVIAFVNDDSMTRLASGMIAGTFSLVTLVVSINQLILSQEFASAGESRNQLEGVVSFRSDIADVANVPTTPAAPTKLLELLVETIQYRTEDLTEAVSDHDEEVRAEISRFAESVEESTGRIDETLEQTSFGTFQAVSAAINYDDTWQRYVAEHLRSRYADSLSPEAEETFDDLIEALGLFNVAREHFKTTYLQRELTRFSQLTIYAGVPAILSALLAGLLYADLGGPSIDATLLPFVVSALVAVVFSPLALLVSYILRTATVTRRTASTGPILPQKDPDEGPFEVSYGDAGGGSESDD